MALTSTHLTIVKNILSLLGQKPAVPRRILSLGYPDLLVHPNQVSELFGSELAGRLVFRPDAAAIIRWHEIGELTDRIIESRHFFRLLGFELDILDIAQVRGDEIILDLNQPCPETLHQRYALVIDGGTCEHCFNIAQAAKNLAEMCAEGGYVLHSNPVNMFNHGFYNLNPTWYHDFYGANGFSVELCCVVADIVRKPAFFEVPATQRFNGIPEKSGLLAVAQRKEIKPITWPMQAKYKQNPTLLG